MLYCGQTGDWKALIKTCANFKPNLDYSPQDDRNSIKSLGRKTMKRHRYNVEEAKRFNENLLTPTATQKKFLSEKKQSPSFPWYPLLLYLEQTSNDLRLKLDSPVKFRECTSNNEFFSHL